MIGRHLLLWGDCFGQAVRRDLQFRTQAVLTALCALAETALGVVPVLLIIPDGDGTALAVAGAYGICSGVIDCFVAPNLRRLDAVVRRGDLDLILVRPVSAGFCTALRWSEPAELGRVPAGIALLVAGRGAAGVGGVPWAVIGTAGFALLWANLAYLTFWVRSAEPVNDIALQVREAGKYPAAYFPRPLRVLLHTVVPVGLLGAMPVRELTGGPVALAAGLAGLAAGMALTAAHWRLAVRRYESAGG